MIPFQYCLFTKGMGFIFRNCIKGDFLGTFNFDFWQFWCPFRKHVIQYLIWKVLIVVWNPQLSMCMAALLHCITPFWKLPNSLHKQTKQRFHMNVAVLKSPNDHNFPTKNSTKNGTLMVQGHIFYHCICTFVPIYLGGLMASIWKALINLHLRILRVWVWQY